VTPVPSIADLNPEPEIPVFRWPDGVIKPPEFWKQHEKDLVALWTKRRDEHRAMVAQMQAARDAADGNV
jgi:hypothetical protein